MGISHERPRPLARDPREVPPDASRLIRALARARVEGSLITTDQHEYEQARRVWNGIADRRPAAIMRARTVNDVTRTIAVAAEAGIQLAVRCGGHSFPGFSTCDDGIVLDLSPMRRVTIDPAARTAEVDGGALLGDVDVAGMEHGLVTPAGVVSHTGAAGLTLGGGMGWLSRRMGLTIDSLLAADVCTADGRIVRASAEESPELFWGLRGGGGNFGVVSRFVFRMHELGPIVTGMWAYPNTQARSALARLATLSADAPRQLTSAFTATCAGTRVTSFWSGSGRGAAGAVAAYGRLAAASAGSLDDVSFVTFQRRYDQHFAWGRRYYAKGGFLDELGHDAIDLIISAVESSPAPDCEIYVLQLGGAVTDIPDADSAYTGRDARFYWIVEPVWDDPADDERCIVWGREAASRLATLSTSGNYVNEQSDVSEDLTLSAYGEDKHARLAALKTQFDPNNLFRLNQNIRPERHRPT